MVRIKRLRRRKLYLFTAACVSCVAVLVLLLFLAGSLIKSRVFSVSPAAEAAAHPAVDAAEEHKESAPVKHEEKTDAGETPGNNKEELTVSQDSAAEEAAETQKYPDPEGRLVYITFDDGPSVYTDRILDILKEYGVKATFFVCGTGDKDESLRSAYKRIVDEGHTIGMHSYSHVYSKVYGDLDLFQYDLDKIRNLIYNETGVVPKYYRFPGGSGNTIASLPMDEYISVLYSQGMEYYDWNVYGGDSSGNRLSPSDIVKNTLDGVDRRKTAVILLHDTGSRKNTVEALPGILEGLKERGLEIKAIDDETPPLHQINEAE